MKCPKCGNEILKGEQFCSRCGFEKNSKKKKVLFTCCVIAIIGLFLLAFLPDIFNTIDDISDYFYERSPGGRIIGEWETENLYLAESEVKYIYIDRGGYIQFFNEDEDGILMETYIVDDDDYTLTVTHASGNSKSYYYDEELSKYNSNYWSVEDDKLYLWGIEFHTPVD